MDAEKFKRKVDAVRGRALMITAYTKDPVIKEKLTSMLEGADLENILIESCHSFDEWKEVLPQKAVPGLARACWEWIRHWGNGGGDSSTEQMIQGAISELKSDEPRKLADAICDSISGYCKTTFEASVLTMDIMNECLESCLEV